MEQIKFVSPQDVELFFKKIHTLRDKAIFSAMYFYALRAGEVRLLNLEDIDLNNGRIFIHALKSGVSGQFLLNPTVKKHIKAYLEQERIKQRTTQKTLFLSQKGSGITPTQIYRLFKKYAKKAKFSSDKQHPHVLRHSLAVHLAEAGSSIYEVKEFLRHRRIANTEIYFMITNKTRMERQREVFNSPMLAKI